MKKFPVQSALLTILFFGNISCSPTSPESADPMSQPHKTVVYQVFTRLYGNTNSTNIPWGTISENGVGKFSDFNDMALQEIKAIGITHIWYTGVPHHALINDYTAYGISNDDPDVVKGRAGSPYAVKDYYNVNPDLAEDPSRRLEEFQELIQRTHKNGLKLIIDIVPNHIARKYEGKNNPEGVTDFGEKDDTSVEYQRDNNFYYIPGKSFSVPVPNGAYKPLGGESHPLSDGKFDEFPAKWTGNGSRLAKPDFNDWYETVKVNYGIRPDGNKDFSELPDGFGEKDFKAHFDFWRDKDVPDSWKKFREIALYWIKMGVDGFRYDMAEMVPVEFWSYMNSAIKMENPEAFLLAEVYNPTAYRDYIHLGKMDYLYDKVELYDTLKSIMQGKGSTDNIIGIQNGLADIEHHMLHFLENHDEQRIASPEFAGDALLGKPAMVLSAMISTAPTMMYFGQEVGEPGAEHAGFGSPSRTSIFDYVGVPHHQRWMNGGKFDGGKSSDSEKSLRDFYQRLLNFTLYSPALAGEYREIHSHNRQHTEWYNDRVYAFVRWSENQKLIMISNFDGKDSFGFELALPCETVATWGLQDGEIKLTEKLFGTAQAVLRIQDGKGKVRVDLQPLESWVLELKQ